jgi:uncharacterized tellurite resistance protein B-like protein
MNGLLIELKEALKKSGFTGTQAEFKKSKELISFCKSEGKIVKVTSPTQLNLDYFQDYHDHLLGLAKEFVKSEGINTWDDLAQHPEMGQVTKILHEFGVRAELFDGSQEEDAEEQASFTLTDLWELAKVHYGFKGSETSFKNWLQEHYGSVAEYCLAKGLPINATKWESHDTAIRVASKLGSINEIKNQSRSLYKYLEAEGLVEKLKLKQFSVDELLIDLANLIWPQEDHRDAFLEKWYINPKRVHRTAKNASVETVANNLAATVSPEELGLLYYDVGLVFDADGMATEEEKMVTAILDNVWRNRMVPYAEQAIRFKKRPFAPHSVVAAIGFILFQAVSVDGNIHVDEVLELKRGLTDWEDFNARNILAAVNFCLHGSNDHSILGLESILKTQKKSIDSVQNCCAYLHSNSTKKQIALLMKNVNKIVEADGVVHENEKWLLDTLESELKTTKKAG